MTLNLKVKWLLSSRKDIVHIPQKYHMFTPAQTVLSEKIHKPLKKRGIPAETFEASGGGWAKTAEASSYTFQSGAAFVWAGS